MIIFDDRAVGEQEKKRSGNEKDNAPGLRSVSTGGPDLAELRTGSTSGLAYRYGIAVLGVIAAAAVREALDPFLGPHSPYLPFTLALILVGRFGGRAPALFATAFSTLTVEWFFIEPRYSFWIANPAATAGLALFTVIGILISFFVGHMRETLLCVARANAKLRSQARLIDLSHDAIITADANRVITGWNRGAEEIYGWSEREVLGQVMHDLLRTKAHIAHGEIDAVLQRDGRWQGDLIHTTRAGRKIEVESRQVLVSNQGSPAAILEVNRDVSDRKRAEEILRESEERYRNLFESMREGFALAEVICDVNGKPVDARYLEVNPAFEVMAVHKREELVGRTYREVFPNAPWESWIAAFGEVALTGCPTRLDEYDKATGRHYEAIAYSPRAGQFAAMFGDVTDRKQAEKRLSQAQKMESVGLLAGGVAHDFNNLLTVIIGTAGSALDACPSCEHCPGILAAAESAAHLTRQLLAYAGKGQAVVDVVDLTELVSKSTQLLGASVPKKSRLTFRLAPDLPCVEADPGRIDQVLMNLVINAGEAVSGRNEATIEVSTGTCEITAETAREQMPRYEVAPGAYVWLEVRDNGGGIDESALSRIFDPFFSTKFTGRGLGLAAVDGIVRSAKGFINVFSSPGTGSSFRVFWPASEKKRRPPVSRCAPVSPKRRFATVLVVEDEERVRKLACIMLKRNGYDVLEASDGQQALDVLASCSAPPAVMLLDLGMPVMGGDELVPIVAQEYPTIKVIVSSGYPEEEARKNSRTSTVAAFLPKPYDGLALGEKIAQVLDVH